MTNRIRPTPRKSRLWTKRLQTARFQCSRPMPLRSTIACCDCRPRCRTCATARRAKSPTSGSTPPCRSSRDLLPVVDNIDRAIEAAEKAGEAENLLAGFRLVKQQLHTLLSRNQCEPIAAEGQVFDPNFHQAILQQPSADVPAGNVMMVTQPGYKMHDRVVRPAQVIVSSGPGEVGAA